MTRTRPNCRCGMPVAQHVTKKAGPNCGRPYFACSATDGKQCKFFEWAGPPVASSSTAPAPRTFSQADDRIDGQCAKCRCPVKHQVVSHNNTKGNAGRRYYSCGACDFFHWLDAPSTVAGATAAGSSQDDGRRISFYAIDDPDTHERLQQLFCVPANVRLGVSM